MEVGIEVEGPQAWLLGNDLTHDCDGAVRDSAPKPGPTRADGLRLHLRHQRPESRQPVVPFTALRI